MESTTISNCDSNKNGVKLHDAADEGRADDVVELLTEDPTLIQIADAMLDTAFHVAVRAGHGSTVLKMMEYLKHGHTELLEEVLCQGNADGDKPLHLALKNGHKDFAFDLALAMVSVMFSTNKDGKNAFDLAKEAGIHLPYEEVDDEDSSPSNIADDEVGDDCEEIVVMVPDERSATSEEEGVTPILKIGIVDIEMKFAAMGNKNDEEDEEFNKLFKAAETGREDVVMEILARNPDTLEGKSKGPEGWTALHVAAFTGNMGSLCKMVQFIQNNSNHLLRLLLAGDHNNSTPLNLALQSPEFRPHHEKAACYLVDVQPRAIYKEDRNKLSPLKLAIENDHPDLVRYMTRTDLSQSIRDSILEYVKKNNIVHYAIKCRYHSSFESSATLHALLEGLPDLINVPDRRGWKLLSYVAFKGYFDEVSYILKCFPNSIRKSDEDGSFPIHKAVVGGHINVVNELLLHYPQALQDIDRKGRNPVELATSYHKKDVLCFLKDINDEVEGLKIQS